MAYSESTRNGKVKAVVFHSGYEKWKYSLKPELWLNASIETWRPLLKRADDAGIKIAIENILEDEPANLKLLMQEMASKTLEFALIPDT